MGGSNTMKWGVLVLCLALALSGVVARRRGGSELHLGEPREWLSSDGGRVDTWDRIEVLEDADVGAARITLKQRGLALPHYSDSATLAYVEQGEGVVGLLTGYTLGDSAFVRRVRQGDVVAIPRGTPAWWYNRGNQDLRILAVADTCGGANPGEYTAFYLIGGKEEEHGSVLHGFSRQLLAEAWGVDEKQLEEHQRSQRGVGIVKLDREIQIPGDSGRPREDSNSKRQEESEGEWGDFVYNLREAGADIRVQNAGHLNFVNALKLPLLRHLRLSANHARLEKNAIYAPSWSPAGHQIVHFLRGNGHLEIAREGGEQLVNQQVREGDVYIIPRFFAAGIKAGESGLEWVSFFTTHNPRLESLAGRTSVYRQLPEEVAAAAFNIDQKLEREIRSKRFRSPILLPPRGREAVDSFQEEDFYLRFLKEA